MMRNEALPPVIVEEPFRLTREEQDFVRKCLNGQFWRSEIPWSLATGLLAKMAMKIGYIKQSKVTIFSAVVGAFVFSRAVSYSTCFQKLVQQPGNTVAERMSQRKRIVQGQPGDRNQPYYGEPESTYTQQPNYLNVDINKPDYPGIDPSIPSPNVDETIATQRPGQTYAELRRQNRESYQQPYRGSRSAAPPPAPEQPMSGPPPPPPASTPYESSSYSFDSSVGSFDRPSYSETERSAAQPQTPERSPYDGRTSRRRTQTNKYGDVWDE